MPNFKISRRKKAIVEPQKPPVEEKVDDSEMMASDSSDEYIQDAIKAVKRVTFEEKPKPRFNTFQPAPKTLPQRPNPPKVDRKPVVLEPKQPYRPPRRRMNDPYIRKPTMDFANPHSKYRRGGAKMRYRSHYGAGGEHLDTRTKANLLYTHCFG